MTSGGIPPEVGRTRAASAPAAARAPIILMVATNGQTLREQLYFREDDHFVWLNLYYFNY